MVPHAAEAPRSFGMSSVELRRRERAFDRLGISALVVAVLSSADLLPAHWPAVIIGIAVPSAAFLAARAWLVFGNARFAQTEWTILDSRLLRTDARSRREYELDSVRRIWTKRKIDGSIREFRIELDDRANVYVNGLRDAESFLDVFRRAVTGSLESEVREPLDFDHPAYYVVLGAVIGAAATALVRFVAYAPGLHGRWVYLGLSVYSITLSGFWSHSRPISGRYGDRAGSWDRAVVVTGIVVAVGAATAACLT